MSRSTEPVAAAAADEQGASALALLGYGLGRTSRFLGLGSRRLFHWSGFGIVAAARKLGLGVRRVKSSTGQGRGRRALRIRTRELLGEMEASYRSIGEELCRSSADAGDALEVSETVQKLVSRVRELQSELEDVESAVAAEEPGEAPAGEAAEAPDDEDAEQGDSEEEDGLDSELPDDLAGLGGVGASDEESEADDKAKSAKSRSKSKAKAKAKEGDEGEDEGEEEEPADEE